MVADRSSRESFFGRNYDMKDSLSLSCWGLYAFPPGTILPTYSFNSEDPTSAVQALRTWAEGVCIPMRTPMPKEKWEELVRHTAYYTWLDEGQPEGRADEHWDAAARQLADLLTTEYVFVRFEQPEVASGTHEADTHSPVAEPRTDVDVSGGQGSGEGASEETRKGGRIAYFLQSLGANRLVAPAGQGTGRLVAAKKAGGEEAKE
jgi:hypothetical protein